MSTKIYDAYKIKRKVDLWPVLWDIRDKAEANVVKKLKELYWEVMLHLNTESEEYQKKLASTKYPEWSVRLDMAREKIREEIQKNVTSRERDTFDISVSISVYPHETGFYLRAFCDQVSCLGGSLDFLYDHPKLRDFHYQNSCDRPDRVSAREWRQREKIWDEIIGEGLYMKNRVELNICDWEAFQRRLDPWLDLAKKYHKKPPVFPIKEEVLARKLRKIEAVSDVRAERGLIVANHGKVTIKKGRSKWASLVEGKTKHHPSVENAVEWVRYQLLPPESKAIIDRMLKDAKAHERRLKAQERKAQLQQRQV